VFNRIWVDTLENLVTIVETLARTVFNAAVSDATSRVKSKGNVFSDLTTSRTCLTMLAIRMSARSSLRESGCACRSHGQRATCSPTTMV
jgi:hypothetical protein